MAGITRAPRVTEVRARPLERSGWLKRAGYAGLTALSVLSSGGMAARTLAGCGAESQTCGADQIPKSTFGFTTAIDGKWYNAGLNPTCTSLDPADLAQGITCVWEPASQPSILGLTNCDGSVTNLTVECGLGEDIFPGTFDANGNFSVTRVLHEKMGQTECRVTSYYNGYTGETITDPALLGNFTFYLYAPNFNGEAPDAGNACQQWPLVISELVITPSDTVVQGATVHAAIPKAYIIDCENRPGTDPEFGATVLIGFDGQDYTASDDGANNFYVDIDTSHHQAGYYELWIRVIDSDHDTRQDKLNSKGITISETQGAMCYDIPGPKDIAATPNLHMVQGSADPVCWINYHLDCNGKRLHLVSHNIFDYLEEDNTTIEELDDITVCGSVLPARIGGAIKLIVADEFGNSKPEYFYLPPIDPIVLTTDANYVQQGVASNFIAPPISGGLNWRFWMTDINNITTISFVDQPNNSVWTVAPPNAGYNKVNLEVTAYNQDKVLAYYPFIAAQAPGQTIDPCYVLDPPGAIQTTPLKSYIIRGDNTQFTSVLSGLKDCKNNDLTLLPNSDNLNSIYYNGGLTYANQALTFFGSLRTNIGSGSTIQVQLGDNWGHTLTVVHYTTPIHEPEVAILDPNNWVTVSEDVPLDLMETPAGCNSLWTGTGPKNFNSPLLGDPTWTVPAASKNVTGLYTLDLAITGGDNFTYHVPGSFIVHADPAP